MTTTIEVDVLPRLEARRYASMTTAPDPAYFPSPGREEQGVAIRAHRASEPVGLALAEIHPDGARSTVVSVYVAPEHRRRGVGRRLFERLEAELSGRGCAQVDLTYFQPRDYTEPLERLLRRSGWPTGAFAALFIHYSERIMEAPWLYVGEPETEGDLFPFAEAGEADRREVEQLIARGALPDYLNPFNGLRLMYPDTSFGLRRGGVLSGWIVTHRITPTTLRYTSFYVREELRHSGAPIALMRRAVMSHTERRHLIPFGIQAIPRAFPGMLRFAHKRLVPWADRTEKMVVATKRFSPAGSSPEAVRSE